MERGQDLIEERETVYSDERNVRGNQTSKHVGLGR